MSNQITDARHQRSALAFSMSAPYYDAEHRANPIARWTRQQSLAVLDRAFGAGDRVLELGCGTGAEAIHLAGRGVQVLATDVAPSMIAEVEKKLAPNGTQSVLRPLISTRVVPASKSGELVDQYGRGAFDGAYSSFGALNCEADLGQVVEALGALVRPGGRVVLSLINRYCLWETAWYLRGREPQQAFRRWSGHAAATVRAEWQDRRVEVFYWTPNEVERRFAPHFKTTRRMALTWLLPPQYLDGLVHRAPGLFRRLARIERRTARRWPFYALGDHFLLEMKRHDA